MVEFSETANKGIAWSIIGVLCIIVILMIVGFIMNYCLEKQIEAQTGKKTILPKMSKGKKLVAMAKETVGLSN